MINFPAGNGYLVFSGSMNRTGSVITGSPTISADQGWEYSQPTNQPNRLEDTILGISTSVEDSPGTYDGGLTINSSSWSFTER
jgi:hypothetical protein